MGHQTLTRTSIPVEGYTRSRRSVPLVLVVLIVGAAAIGIANILGLWWVTMVMGAVIGTLRWRPRISLGVAGLCGLLGWGLALLRLGFAAHAGSTASVVAGIMGAGSGAVVIAITLLLGVLLCLAGCWPLIALRGLGRRASTL